MPAQRYMEECGSAAMLAAKRLLAGVAPEVNLGECVTCMSPPAAYSGFQTQRRHHQKSKRGVSVAPQIGLLSSKFFFKKLIQNTPGIPK